MEFFVTFFRDIIDGPAYIIVTVVAAILLCACIGYLAEKKLKSKKQTTSNAAKNNVQTPSNPNIAQPTSQANQGTEHATPDVLQTVTATPVVNTEAQKVYSTTKPNSNLNETAPVQAAQPNQVVNTEAIQNNISQNIPAQPNQVAANFQQQPTNINNSAVSTIQDNNSSQTLETESAPATSNIANPGTSINNVESLTSSSEIQNPENINSMPVTEQAQINNDQTNISSNVESLSGQEQNNVVNNSVSVPSVSENEQVATESKIAPPVINNPVEPKPIITKKEEPVSLDSSIGNKVQPIPVINSEVENTPLEQEAPVSQASQVVLTPPEVQPEQTPNANN